LTSDNNYYQKQNESLLTTRIRSRHLIAAKIDELLREAAHHRAHARVTSMEDIIAETRADDIEGIGIKLALYVELYVYMSSVAAERAASAAEQVLSAYKDCGRVLGRDLLAEVKGLMPTNQQGL
jgi:hypothetical protein